jgi:uncharacterized protein (DUF488 family)
MSRSENSSPPGLIGVGYQGRTLGELTAHLLALQVSRLVDVRLNPISRKPGLSKTALGRALAAAGISYEHRRELGNPTTNRAGFAGNPAEREAARARYRDLLHRPEANAALNAIADAARRERVAILCFEADEHRCHRDIVLHEAHQKIAAAAAGKAGTRGRASSRPRRSPETPGI